MSQTLYYLISKKDWTSSGEHFGSPLDLADGFIHLSSKEHLSRVAAKFFHNTPDVQLLILNGSKLKGEIEWITSQSTGSQYAHLHGSIPQDAVMEVVELGQDSEGHQVLPDLR